MNNDFIKYINLYYGKNLLPIKLIYFGIHLLGSGSDGIQNFLTIAMKFSTYV